jgi:hypothetical protein
VVDDYGFPDQPMLDEMTAKALRVLDRQKKGFVLMVEGASIDKQAHAMDRALVRECGGNAGRGVAGGSGGVEEKVTGEIGFL